MPVRKFSQLQINQEIFKPTNDIMEEEDNNEVDADLSQIGALFFNNNGIIQQKQETEEVKAEIKEASPDHNNPLLGVVDFPFVVTTTDKGNTMLVTDSQTPGYRHHWSVHTRRTHRAENVGDYAMERYACIKCKQQSRDTNACMFAPCLSVILLSNGDLILKTHPWTGIRQHICPGIPADESDACLLLRRKRQDIVKLRVDPKDAFDELMQEVEEMPGWSAEKKLRVCALIGDRKRNERTFHRCRLKGRKVRSTNVRASSCSANEGSLADFDGEAESSCVNDSMTALVSDLAAEIKPDLATLFAPKANSNGSTVSQVNEEVGATASISVSSSTIVQDWIENEMSYTRKGSCGGEFISAAPPPPTLAVRENMGIYSMFPNSKVPSGDISYASSSNSVSTIKKASKREFNFSIYPQRRIALMFLYCGWEHDGLVAQPDTLNTVEEHLFGALMKTRLIRDQESCQWTRCGRTDKGVSAFKQVAAVTVRSNDVNAEGIFWSVDSNPTYRVKNTAEHNFVKMLNGVLPRSIRVVAWSPTHRDFNARFNCTSREYTYIFPRGKIDVTAMNEGCSQLIGVHDFRNVCHIDNNKNRLEMSYEREIFDAHVDFLLENKNDKYSLLKLTVKASGFLWHQIRCIVTVLYEIGCRHESPNLVADLLDIRKCPARPQYGLANELPLCLFDCSYPDADLQWNFDVQILSSVIETLQRMWAELQVKASMVKSMINGIQSYIDADESHNNITVGLEEFTTAHTQTKNYIQMMKRPRCQSLEERIEKSAKRMKED